MIPKYVIVTAAMNERGFIEKTLEAVIAQTFKPARYVIVNDGSTDTTGELIDEFAARYDFIKAIHIQQKTGRNFASKVYALRMGIEKALDIDTEFLCILDADISFESDFYERVIQNIYQDPSLGIASGFIYEKKNDKFRSRPMNTTLSVAGAIQVFRTECYKQTGGFIPMELGSEDWYLEIKARSLGWKVIAFPGIPAYHHRPTGITTQSITRREYNCGVNEYRMGSIFLFTIIKSLRRILQRPLIFGSFFRIYGFLHSWFTRIPKIDDKEVILFLRAEQRRRLFFKH